MSEDAVTLSLTDGELDTLRWILDGIDERDMESDEDRANYLSICRRIGL